MRKKKNLLILVVLLILSFSVIDGKHEHIANLENVHTVTCDVVRVVDGDTIVVDLNGEKCKVRLIGIDTPESVHPDKSRNTEKGKLASEYTKKLLDGKQVKLEFDVQETDKYGRLLAYVYLPDGTFINEKLILDGYAKIATFPPNVKHVEVFKTASKQAENN